jgi:serine/threonine protein kinase
MEYYPYSLSNFIKSKEKKGFKLKEIVKIGFEIAKGLRHLHNLTPPIIHRDLKVSI